MDILTETEIANIVSQSKLAEKYNQVIDSESAHEILSEKLEDAAKSAPGKKEEKEKSIFDDPVVKSMTRTAGNTIVRALLGVLGIGGRSRRRKSIF